jgi:hypothetical protein
MTHMGDRATVDACNFKDVAFMRGSADDEVQNGVLE